MRCAYPPYIAFLCTIQLVMAGNDTEGVRYGIIETPEKYYLNDRWRMKSGIIDERGRNCLTLHLEGTPL